MYWTAFFWASTSIDLVSRVALSRELSIDSIDLSIDLRSTSVAKVLLHVLAGALRTRPPDNISKAEGRPSAVTHHAASKLSVQSLLTLS